MRWDATLYDQQHAFVYAYGADVLALLAPQPGERILDLGCGTGPLTAQIAQAGAHVVGLDQSADMIAKARAAYPALEFLQGDAADFAFAEPFDAVFSNAVLHWVLRPEAAAICIARALKPGGRFVAEFGGQGNVARITNTLETVVAEKLQLKVSAQNYFPGIGEYASLLERHGLQVRSAALLDRMTKLSEGEAGLRNWLWMFRRAVLEQIPAERQDEMIAEVETRLRGELFKDGDWYADYVRLRIVAVRAPLASTK